LKTRAAFTAQQTWFATLWLRMGWTPTNVCPKVMGRGGVRVQFTVGLKLKGKTDRIAVDAEDSARQWNGTPFCGTRRDKTHYKFY
jgi:hypothetical protein